MADEPDISGMPDPSAIGLDPAKQTDPTAEMPDPEDLYRKAHFGPMPNANGKLGPMEPIPKDLVDAYMADPESANVTRKSLKKGLSSLTGLPRVAAVMNPVTPVVAGIAGGAGALTGALGAAFDPDNAAKHLQTGRERLRDWSSGVYKLADYLPATKEGAAAADTLNDLPHQIGKNVNDNVVRPLAGDNVADTVGDVAMDAATVLPGAGIKGVVKGGVKLGAKAVKGVKGAYDSEAASINPPEPEAPTKLPVGEALTGEDLRKQPNPIPPPEGTQAHARTAPNQPPAESQPAAAPNADPGASPAVASEPDTLEAALAKSNDPFRFANGEMKDVPAGQRGSFSFQNDNDLNRATGAARDKQRGVGINPRNERTEYNANRQMGGAQRTAEQDDIIARLSGGQRGSVRLFNAPKDEGPQETPSPEQQAKRAEHLDKLDALSGKGLPSRRQSALTGDYNATGNDWQEKETGNAAAEAQIASENKALHTATDNVHKSIGSDFEDSIDPQTVGNRGRVTRNAIQGIEQHFKGMTDEAYDAARAAHGDSPMPTFLTRANSFLADEANYMPDSFRRSAQARLQQLKTVGDNGVDGSKPAAPGSVAAAEKFREWLNKNRTLDNMHTTKQLVDHTDMDVAEHGGENAFTAARAMRRHQFQMLEEPVGIKKLLTPSDSQGINHAIPEHKVMDYIADLPREQHEHVMNVLRAGAHLSPDLAESSAAAIREIQAHTVSRLHDAAKEDGGKWNARKFANAANVAGRNAESTFKDRPDVLENLKTINDAGNTLHMDKHYPGAVGQAARTTALGHVVDAGAGVASSLVHHVPGVGRLVGRAIESGAEGLGGKISEANREKDFAKRLVDRNGKQRGSVQVMPSKEDFKDAEHVTLATPVAHALDEHGDHIFSTGEGKSHLKAEDTEDGGLRVRGSFTHLDDQRQGHGGVLYKHAADQALKNGGSFTSDEKVSEPAARRWAELQRQGYKVERNPGAVPTADRGLITKDGSPVFSIKPSAKSGPAQLNVGLHIGDPANGGRVNNPREVVKAIQELGVKPTRGSVVQSGSEPTLVTDIHRPLTKEEGVRLAARTGQESIAQRHADGSGTMLGSKVNSEKAKAEGWDKYNPDYFRQHDGRTQSEHEAPLKFPESQRGSVRVMNEKPLAGAPEGDKPNGKARAAAATYAKSAGIDYQPLSEYRYVDPKVAKNVADAYEEMKHDPTNPKVAKAYDAFKTETLEQFKQMQKAGVKVDLDPSYPYKNPREMHEDVRANNHMSIYPTEAGFGSEGAPPSDHPMLEKAPIKIGGKDATYNDLFRAVHDYYGHAAEGNGFRANGEYNAWRAHRQMYSDAARGAMDSETLGQNSWVNSGPVGELNKGASGESTIYADQKAGLLPKSVVKSAEEGVGADEHHITNQLTDSERNQLRADTTKRFIDAFHGTPATEEYAAAALAGAAKRGWYRDSAQAIVNQFGHEAPRFAGLLSAMSPQVSVQTNFANALKTYINWDKEGRPQDPGAIRDIMERSSQKSATAAPGSSNVLDAWVNNAVRALTSDDPTNIKLSGPKVHSFYNNLTDNVHEVTNDAWMASFAKIDPAKLGGSLNKSGPGKSPSYLALSAKVRAAASMISRLTGERWTPAEVQETVWSWAKTAYEHAEEKGSNVSIPDLVKNGDITDELIRSTPDFHQLFGTSEHRGFLQSSRFASNADRVAPGKGEGAAAAGSSKARAAAAASLQPHLLAAAKRLEEVRQERRAAGKSAPKDEEDD